MFMTYNCYKTQNLNYILCRSMIILVCKRESADQFICEINQGEMVWIDIMKIFK